MDFQELEVLFWKRKNHRNSSFDSNSPPRGHQLFINICLNIVTKKSRKKTAFLTRGTPFKAKNLAQSKFKIAFPTLNLVKNLDEKP
jgi:hypothetical protein